MGAKGTEPTKVLRLPVWLLDELTPEAAALGVTVPTLITQRLARPQPTPPGVNSDAVRCQCKTPTLSKHVSNLCTTCHLMR